MPVRLGSIVALVAAVAVHASPAAGGSRPTRTLASASPRSGSTTLHELFVWVPRTLLTPLRATVEHLLRRPIVALVTLAEEHRVPARVRDVLTWGPNRSSAVVPTALIDFGLRPSVGLYLFSDDWLYDNQSLRLHLATGGSGWYRVSGSFRHHLARAADHRRTRTLELHAEVERRTDRFHWGLGPSARDEARARYTELHAEAHLAFRALGWRSSRLDVFVGLRAMRFGDEEGAIASAVTRGAFAPLARFSSGYELLRSGVHAVLDSHPRRRLDLPPESDAPEPGRSGLRAAARVELAGEPGSFGRSGPTGDPSSRFVRYGLKLAASVDVLRSRVLAARFTADFIDPIVRGASAGDAIPFAELATLGGAHPLRGFLPGRLLGRSALSATLEYAWPIWVWLEGTAHYAVGNAFGPHLDGADARRLRQSFGIGMRSNREGELGFELLLAAGTRTFEDGGAPESLRFVVGSALDL